jgi:hypothetical protein
LDQAVLDVQSKWSKLSNMSTHHQHSNSILFPLISQSSPLNPPRLLFFNHGMNYIK